LPGKYWPAITYWIAVQSSNSMHVLTVPLHLTLLETGMEVIAKVLLVCKRGNQKFLHTIMHHPKRSQQPLYADESGHVFFPQSSIATISTGRGALAVTSCK